MKKRRIGRKVLRQKHHKNVLRPFTEQTPIRCLIDKASYGALRELLEKLHPYLLDKDATICDINRLFFDMNTIKGKHEFVIAKLAEFLINVEKENGLKVRKSIFYRYFSDPNHCNLEIAESSMKALITKAKRVYF